MRYAIIISIMILIVGCNIFNADDTTSGSDIHYYPIDEIAYSRSMDYSYLTLNADVQLDSTIKEIEVKRNGHKQEVAGYSNEADRPVILVYGRTSYNILKGDKIRFIQN